MLITPKQGGTRIQQWNVENEFQNGHTLVGWSVLTVDEHLSRDNVHWVWILKSVQCYLSAIDIISSREKEMKWWNSIKKILIALT
jgi:hypothetical protein